MKKETKRFLLICPLALATLLVPSFLGSNPSLSAFLLLIISLFMLLSDWNIKNIFFYLAVFVSGPLAEAIGIHFGLWGYAQPVFIGIPLWLPFVWGNAGLYVVNLKSAIDSISDGGSK